MNQVIIQGIGYLALLFVVLSFQHNNRRRLLFYMLIGLVLFIIHYALLGAWVGSLMNVIEAAMVLVGYRRETDKWAQRKFWPYAFIGIFVIAGILTAKTYVDILPVIAQIIGTIAVWQTNPRVIRYIMLLPRPLWFTYNFVVGSYAGMTTEVVVLLSVLVGIVRFDILKQKQPAPLRK
jgi:hypothetical protein